MSTVEQAPQNVFAAVRQSLTSHAQREADFAPRADPDDPAWQPTEARPGSPEKIAVLCRRLEAGVPLWHPGDRTCLCPPAWGIQQES